MHRSIASCLNAVDVTVLKSVNNDSYSVRSGLPLHSTEPSSCENGRRHGAQQGSARPVFPTILVPHVALQRVSSRPVCLVTLPHRTSNRMDAALPHQGCGLESCRPRPRLKTRESRSRRDRDRYSAFFLPTTETEIETETKNPRLSVFETETEIETRIPVPHAS